MLSEGVIRSDTWTLLSLYSGLFLFLWYWIKNFSSVGSILLMGILCRLLFGFHLPELSQDFYRYLWDGHIQQLGINPYLYTPDKLINSVGFPDAQLLFEKMGPLSAGNFSNYPPASQWLFKFASLFHQEKLLDGVLILRGIYFMGDLALFFIGISFLKKLNLEPNRIAWYFLNPLIIIEGIGNLHGESLMFCFTLISCFYLLKKQSVLGGIFMAIAIALKLIHLLLIPIFYKFLGVKKFFSFCLSIVGVSFLFWFPFWEGSMPTHYKDTIDLWFTTFEFNGSLYNVIRAVGYEVKGYNIIRQLGKITPFIVFGLVVLFTFFRSNRTAYALIQSMLFLLSSYFFMATTVHPWYLINLIFFGIVTGYAFPLVWSLSVFWSYSAYGSHGFEENTFIQFAEYLLVYGVFIWEVIKQPLGQHFQKAHFFDTELSPISPR